MKSKLFLRFTHYCLLEFEEFQVYFHVFSKKSSTFKYMRVRRKFRDFQGLSQAARTLLNVRQIDVGWGTCRLKPNKISILGFT